VPEHLGALDIVYNGVITSHRQAVQELDELDPITQDILIEQTQDLEMYHWFVRAHLESAEGGLATDGATSETEAAAQARKRIA
jgi:starvation-inducible DNA-binding protein